MVRWIGFAEAQNELQVSFTNNSSPELSTCTAIIWQLPMVLIAA